MIKKIIQVTVFVALQLAALVGIVAVSNSMASGAMAQEPSKEAMSQYVATIKAQRDQALDQHATGMAGAADQVAQLKRELEAMTKKAAGCPKPDEEKK